VSFDVDLTDPVTGECLEADAPHHMRGGTYVLGGRAEMTLNVTYNYSPHYRRVLDVEAGLRWLDQKTAAEALPRLEAAAAALGDEVSDDYWEPTEGNAKRALLQLAAFARMRPDGVFRVS
jgi:hypothetical protein